ncbi:hypothetical protein San01_12090 [Streptomyces angustmyceticus]|uniref:Uncharacterized protein n=1 Tax=Streptomyces angustmyceticus TaxID=285578 RepID=A0A5J4L925_9ACTN|nr:hypothetical protein San01_12090 [Streptomyces angustmyceticus]
MAVFVVGLFGEGARGAKCGESLIVTVQPVQRATGTIPRGGLTIFVVGLFGECTRGAKCGESFVVTMQFIQGAPKVVPGAWFIMKIAEGTAGIQNQCSDCQNVLRPVAPFQVVTDSETKAGGAFGGGFSVSGGNEIGALCVQLRQRLIPARKCRGSTLPGRCDMSVRVFGQSNVIVSQTLVCLLVFTARGAVVLTVGPRFFVGVVA